MTATRKSGWAALAVTIATVVGSGGAPASADPAVIHVPPAEVTAGDVLELAVDAGPTTPSLTLHYRAIGSAAFATVELVRQADQRWIAVVPAIAVEPPGVEYYLAAGGVEVFASSTWPHELPVVATPSTERRARDFARAQGRRSRIHTAYDYVTYGTARGVADHYYRIDADFAYRLWAYPLEELRVGYTRLFGVTQSDDMSCAVPPCSDDAGFKVAGWFELGLAAVEGLRFDGRVMVMATQSGFQPGARGEARLGVRESNHVALGVEYLADVGSTAFFRLGWGTVPSLPMAATVEITDLPASSRDAGVRLYYDIAHALPNGFRLGFRIGYASRNQRVLGITGGASASVEF